MRNGDEEQFCGMIMCITLTTALDWDIEGLRYGGQLYAVPVLMKDYVDINGGSVNQGNMHWQTGFCNDLWFLAKSSKC